MFLRGAIGWGEYTQEENTFLGPAIDDVASWYENSDWIGVIVTPRSGYSIQSYSDDRWIGGLNDFVVLPFIKYDVPMKGGSSLPLLAYNWPGFIQAQLDVEKKENPLVRNLMEMLFAKQNPFDASVLRKYENTLKFVDCAITHVKKLPDTTV